MSFKEDGQVEVWSEFEGQEPYEVIRIGWLDSDHPFPAGDVPEDFLTKLTPWILKLVEQTRGFQVCPFCTEEPQPTLPGTTFRLGSAEILVKSKEGLLYSSPNLIYHFIDRHKYLPPAAFIQAVLDSAQ